MSVAPDTLTSTLNVNFDAALIAGGQTTTISLSCRPFTAGVLVRQLRRLLFKQKRPLKFVGIRWLDFLPARYCA